MKKLDETEIYFNQLSSLEFNELEVMLQDIRYFIQTSEYEELKLYLSSIKEILYSKNIKQQCNSYLS